MTASRGRYPESSSIENTKKNVVTTGSTMATAYVTPIVMRP